MGMSGLSFTALEVVSLIGLVQCVYLLVHVIFRSGSFVLTFVPVTYFLVLGCAFFFDAARSNLSQLSVYYEVLSWMLWAFCIPLSVLVIVQLSKINELPSALSFCVLLTVPVAFFFSQKLIGTFSSGCEQYLTCPEFYELLNISGAVAGALSLLVIWSHRNLFLDILQQKAGKERYWLILALIILNIALIAVILLNFDSDALNAIRTVLGLAFVYLVSTSLLRIYPNAFTVTYKRLLSEDALSEDKDIAEKIMSLLTLDKIYHESTYSRTDLAQELGISEAAVSRVIKNHFGKSFPKLLNEYRVEDSKHLLLDTDESIKVISQEVGFNSLPSFNRCFKEIVGQSPSSFRSNIIK